MHLGGRERADDGAMLEELFESVPVNADWTVGFLTALCSGPDAIEAETWVAEIVQDAPLEDDPGARTKIDTLARLYASIGDALRTTPEMICPEPDKPEQEAIDFCLGYLRGAQLHARWTTDEAERAALAPFEILAKLKADDVDDARRATEREHLGANVAAIYARWQAKRQVVNTTPKVGRNDPCPCGSGKKHKKCCAR